MTAAKGRPSENLINYAFAEPGDYSNVLNEHANRDDNDSDYSPDGDSSYDGIMNWNQCGSTPEGNKTIKINE